MWDIVEEAWERPFHLASDLARAAAREVAFAASMGWIGNIHPDGRSFSRKWHLTPEGAMALRHRGHLTPNPRTSE